MQPKIIIIGAGIIGLTSAYFLHKLGYKVTVLEKENEAGLGSTAYNGAQLSYTYIDPLGRPGLIQDIFQILIGSFPVVKVSKDLKTLLWLSQLLWQSSSSKFKSNKAELLKLSIESKKAMDQLLQSEKPEFSFHEVGKLVLSFSASHFEKSVYFAKILKNQMGIDMQVLNADEARSKADLPGFKFDSIKGAVFSPIDAIGNSFLFAQYLTQTLKEEGVEFYFSTSIDRFTTSKAKIISAHSGDQVYTGDAFIICAGVSSANICQLIDIKIPLLPIKGYTCNIHNDLGLKYSISDTKRKIVFTPLADQIRIAGMADIGYSDPKPDPIRVQVFKDEINQVLPDLNIEKVEVQSRLRPCLPSSVPLIRRIKYPNLYVNTGHGFLGWTLAMGSAKRLEGLVKNFP